MNKVAVDVLVEIRYTVKDGSAIIYTNARTDNGALHEILSNWVQDQVGRGADYNNPADLDVFKIKIGLVLEDDSFCTESDTNNKGLTCGLVMDVLRRLKDIPVKTLAERPA